MNVCECTCVSVSVCTCAPSEEADHVDPVPPRGPRSKRVPTAGKAGRAHPRSRCPPLLTGRSGPAGHVLGGARGAGWTRAGMWAGPGGAVEHVVQGPPPSPLCLLMAQKLSFKALDWLRRGISHPKVAPEGVTTRTPIPPKSTLLLSTPGPTLLAPPTKMQLLRGASCSRKAASGRHPAQARVSELLEARAVEARGFCPQLPVRPPP